MQNHKAKSWTGVAPAPRPYSVDGAYRSHGGGSSRVGCSAESSGVAAGPVVVCDGPRLIVSSVRRKARARPSFADSRHPRRVSWKLN